MRTRNAAHYRVFRHIHPFELSGRTNRNRRVDLATASILYRYRIVAANGGTIEIGTVTRRGRHIQTGIGKVVRALWLNRGGRAPRIGVRAPATHCVQLHGTVVTAEAGHRTESILHHFQFRGHKHVAAVGVGAVVNVRIFKLYRVVIIGVVAVRQRDRKSICSVCSAHIGMLSSFVLECPCHLCVVAHHARELGSQRQTVLVGTHIVVRSINGNYRAHRYRNRHHQIAGGHAETVGGHNMVRQRHDTRRVVDKALVVHGSLLRLAVRTGDAVLRIHLRGIP